MPKNVRDILKGSDGIYAVDIAIFSWDLEILLTWISERWLHDQAHQWLYISAVLIARNLTISKFSGNK